jgi:hypothetical protein
MEGDRMGLSRKIWTAYCGKRFFLFSGDVPLSNHDQVSHLRPVESKPIRQELRHVVVSGDLLLGEYRAGSRRPTDRTDGESISSGRIYGMVNVRGSCDWNNLCLG